MTEFTVGQRYINASEAQISPEVRRAIQQAMQQRMNDLLTEALKKAPIMRPAPGDIMGRLAVEAMTIHPVPGNQQRTTLVGPSST